MGKKRELLQYVELHERTWGDDMYPDRPGLEDILSAEIVAFWRVSRRGKLEPNYRITLHDNLIEVERRISKAFVRMHLESPKERFICAFKGDDEIRAVGVRIRFERVGD